MAHSCSQTHCPGLLSAGHPKEKDTKADQRNLETTILKDLKIGSLTMETVLRVAADRTRLSGLKHQTEHLCEPRFLGLLPILGECSRYGKPYWLAKMQTEQSGLKYEWVIVQIGWILSILVVGCCFFLVFFLLLIDKNSVKNHMHQFPTNMCKLMQFILNGILFSR